MNTNATPRQPAPRSDPRLDAFEALLRAIDSHNVAASKVATRSLRALGLSVCLTAGPRPDPRRAS